MQAQSSWEALGPICNEYDRAVVALSLETGYDNGAQYVPIAWDSVGTNALAQPAIIGSLHEREPYCPRWGVICVLCSDRAMRTVGGLLRVQNKVITPERYIGLWREALMQPLTAGELARRHGLRLLVTISAVFDKVQGSNCGSSDSPFPTFEAFAAVYANRFVHRPQAAGAPDFELTLDLQESDAVRHAHHAHALLSRRYEAKARISLTLADCGGKHSHPPPAAAQAILFEEEAQ